MGALIFTIALIIVLVVGWHLIFPILGGVIAISAIAWLFIVGSIIAFSIGILLLFFITGVGIFVLAVIALIWTVIAIILFPILFPILIPLFIIFLFISRLRRRQIESKKGK
jgi:hypothetical protein